MILRDAAAGDAGAIADIWNPLIRDTAITFTPTEKTRTDIAALLADRQADGYAFLVATDPDGLLGFASYAQFRSGAGYARTMEHTVILAPRAQGRGVGRVLLRALEDHARAGGAHSMVAGVSSANPGGLRFHAALDYSEAAVLRQVGWKFGRWYDLHLMQKML